MGQFNYPWSTKLQLAIFLQTWNGFTKGDHSHRETWMLGMNLKKWPRTKAIVAILSFHFSDRRFSHCRYFSLMFSFSFFTFFRFCLCRLSFYYSISFLVVNAVPFSFFFLRILLSFTSWDLDCRWVLYGA